jgi:hypothetical protein
MNTKKGSFALSLILLLAVALSTPAVAQKGGKPGKVSHTARQIRPIQLGTSGGNALDIANGYCCSGTLGALVQKPDLTQYILSNTHVLAGDSVSGGNGRTSTIGDPIIQPGLVDVSCQTVPNDYVGYLSDWAKLNSGSGSVVDAAIAQVIPNMVRSDGAILEIGTISAATAPAVPGRKVKKSGRTTGLTRSSIDSVNANVTVQYYDECAGSTFTTTFTGQIIITNRGSKFLNSGDSGSLMVEDVAVNPRAVGLLFAGSNTVAIANPIGDVLTHFNVSMVGIPPEGTSTSDADDLQLQRDVAHAKRVQQLNAYLLSKVPKGVGHAVGLSGQEVVIKVLVEEFTAEALDAVPPALDGFRVVIEEVGKIVAY